MNPLPLADMPVENILDYQISAATIQDCIAYIVARIERGDRRRYLVCANPHSLEVARKDPEFDAAIRNADLIVPDGVGIVIASKILGGSIRERVTGMDIFLGLSDALNKENNYRYFFLGSTEQNLLKIKEKIAVHFPGITVAETYSPPFTHEFTEEDNELMVEAVTRANPDVLWVGMTAPKQEKWIYQNRKKLNVKFIGAIGAAFDFYTGSVKRSHPVFQKMGLEWLPRLIRQPRKLWYRNFVSNPSFLLRAMQERFLK
jgi:N-acetylglucosaminyldiphosphoundecaprenol N-acetyl-beta-D-mannosaminyltransferase